MKPVLKSVLVYAFLIILSATVASRVEATIVIDTFDSPPVVFTQQVCSPTVGPCDPSLGVGGLSNVLGAARDMDVLRTSGGGNTQAYLQSGLLNLATPPTTDANLTVRWDGTGSDPTTIDFNLGSVNFSGEAGVSFRADAENTGSTVRFRFFTTNASNFYEATLAIPDTLASLQDFFINFASFSATGAPSLSDVDAIEMFVNTANAADMQFDFVQTGVPEPSSLVLIGSGLLGLVGFFSLRKNPK